MIPEFLVSWVRWCWGVENELDEWFIDLADDCFDVGLTEGNFFIKPNIVTNVFHDRKLTRLRFQHNICLDTLMAPSYLVISWWFHSHKSDNLYSRDPTRPAHSYCNFVTSHWEPFYLSINLVGSKESFCYQNSSMSCANTKFLIFSLPLIQYFQLPDVSFFKTSPRCEQSVLKHAFSSSSLQAAYGMHSSVT